MSLDFDASVLESLPEDERKEVARELAQLSEAVTENPLLVYFPHEKQATFHKANTPIKAFIGGNRSGKSQAGIADSLIQSVDAECLPDHLRGFKTYEPPFYCRVISPDFTSTMEGVIFEKIRQLAPKDQLVGEGWEKAYDKQRRVLRFKNGSWWQFMTQEQDLDKFGGAALHRIYYDEEPGGTKGEDIRKENLMRLIDYGGDEVFTMTPLLGLSWVYDEIWEQRHSEGISVVQVDIDDNPYLNQEAKERILAGYSAEELKARKSGHFVHLEGLFYPEFSDDLHVVRPATRERLRAQDIVVGIDPGLKRTGVVWVAADSDNALLAFDELYPTETLIPDIAREIKLRNKKWGVEPEFYVIDPSARNRNAINMEQVEAEYAREGVICLPGQASRPAGIMEIKRRLEQGTLSVSESCKALVWEFGRYRRDAKANDEFAAVKQDDHLLDALRYVVMARAWGTPPVAARTKRHAYSPHFQPPYREEKFIQTNSPPMGAFS